MADFPKVPRADLAKVFGDLRVIKAFEALQQSAVSTDGSTLVLIEQAQAQADSATAAAQLIEALFYSLKDIVEQEPRVEPHIPAPEVLPAALPLPIPVNFGGTGVTQYTLGDIVYAPSRSVLTPLAGNTTTTRKFLRQTGDGTNSAAPAWDTLIAGDIPDISATYQPLDGDLTAIAALSTTGLATRTASNTWTTRTVTAGTAISVTDGDGVAGNPTITNTGVTAVTGTASQVIVSGATGSVTFSLPQNIATTSTPTFAGTILNGALQLVAPSGGNPNKYLRSDTGNFEILNSAFSSVIYALSNAGAITIGTWQATPVTELYGGTNQTSYVTGDVLYASGANTLSKLTGNTTTTRQFLSQTGSGSASAAPAWTALAAGDIPDISATYQPLDADLTALAALGSTGLAARTAANTWAQRTITAGTAISVADGNGVAGNPTITNTGVTSAVGTANQVNVSGATGAVTFSLPQSIHSGASPTFAGGTINGALNIVAPSGSDPNKFLRADSGNFEVLNSAFAAIIFRLSNDGMVSGNGFLISEGSNKRSGVSTLVGGTVTVSNTSVTANSRILLTGQNTSGTAGELTVSAKTASTSFVITSSSVLDTRDVYWQIWEPAAI